MANKNNSSSVQKCVSIQKYLGTFAESRSSLFFLPFTLKFIHMPPGFNRFLFIYGKCLHIETSGDFFLGLWIFKWNSRFSFHRACCNSDHLITSLPKHLLFYVTQNFLKGDSSSLVSALFKETQGGVKVNSRERSSLWSHAPWPQNCLW